MKKAMIIFMILTMMLSMVACGRKPATTSDDTESSEIIEEEVPATEPAEGEGAEAKKTTATAPKDLPVLDSSMTGFAFGVLGRTYADLEQELGPFSERIRYNGAFFYTTKDNHHIGFSKNDIAHDDGNVDEVLCTSYMGKLSEIFNVSDDASIQDIADILGIEFDEDSLSSTGDEMNDVVVWVFLYDNKEHKVILHYDEDIKVVGADLVLTSAWK